MLVCLGLYLLNPVSLDFSSLETALKKVLTEDCFIIGGEKLYQATLTMMDGIYLTRIHADYDGDTFYPEIPPDFKEKKKWNKIFQA